jgi:formate hydrogenlyase subunit 3/multisubunit Na+/H+ antiporter MnhD subunit
MASYFYMEDELVKLLAFSTVEMAHYICMGILLVKVLAIIISVFNW